MVTRKAHPAGVGLSYFMSVLCPLCLYVACSLSTGGHSVHRIRASSASGGYRSSETVCIICCRAVSGWNRSRNRRNRRWNRWNHDWNRRNNGWNQWKRSWNHAHTPAYRRFQAESPERRHLSGGAIARLAAWALMHSAVLALIGTSQRRSTALQQRPIAQMHAGRGGFLEQGAQRGP